MSRVHIFCEGQTEEVFVRELLYPHFANLHIWLNPIIVSTGRDKGGVSSYGKIQKQITIQCKRDPKAYVTTLMDYYAFPQGKNGLSPLRQERDPIAKAKALTEAFQNSVGHSNFIANLVVHEYEGLLFSFPEAFGDWFDKSDVSKLREIRNSVDTPEHINDGRETAPSKRILGLCQGYMKTFHGPLLASDIGLDAIRRECPVFDSWLTRLEKLPVDANHENNGSLGV